MIHSLITEKKLQKAILEYCINECGYLESGWTKKEIKENYHEIFYGNPEAVCRYMEKNNLFVVIDDTKDIRSQIKESDVTINEILEALFRDRKDLLEALNDSEKEEGKEMI